MTLEPSRLALLPLLEMTPDRVDAAPQLEGCTLTLRGDLQWQTDRPVTERLRFEAAAWPLHRARAAADDAVSCASTPYLPPDYNPRTLAWAAELRRQPELAQADARTLVPPCWRTCAAASSATRWSPAPTASTRSTSSGSTASSASASTSRPAFVVVMRALDVPARVVTGYQGTDPIAARRLLHRAPEQRPRLGRVLAAAATAGCAWTPPPPWRRSASCAAPAWCRGRAWWPAPSAASARSCWRSCAARWEALNNRWNQWVMNYSRSQQFHLLESLGVDAPNWHDLAYALIALLCAGSLAGAGWALWDRHRQDPVAAPAARRFATRWRRWG